MDHEEAKKIAEAFVRCVEASEPGDVFTDDVFCDINVPDWRFQMQGVDAVRAWLAGELPNGSSVPSWRCDPLPNGVLVELEQRYQGELGTHYSRNMHRLEVRGGRVSEWTMYCSGDWTPEVQERQAREAPMLRP